MNQLDPTNILLVDDRPENLLVLENLLKFPGVNLIKAASGNEALSQLLSNDFALVLLDVQMPGMDGFEVAELMRSREKTKHIPIVFITAISKEKHYIFKGYESGAVDFLFKPIEAGILKSKVRVFLDLDRQKKKLEWEIQERQRIERELVEARKNAERANRSKSQFLANMSHEIRTPMNAIIGMTELALDMPLGEELREYLSIVKSSSDTLLTIINDIIDFSKIEANKLDLESEPFDLRETLHDALNALAIRAHEKNLELIFFIDPTVPNNLIGDAIRLRQILVNLIGNAIKFTSQGEIGLYATVREETDNGIILHFQVRDSGIGIPNEKHDLIFREFEQADLSTTRKFGGTGLGLAISTRLIGMMNGTIWIESPNPYLPASMEGNPGSVFHFTAKLAKSPAPANQPESPDLTTLIDVPALIADDNESIRQLISTYLNYWQLKPSTVSHVEDLFPALESSVRSGAPIQLLILDAVLSGKNCFEIVESLRRHPSFSPIKIVILNPLGKSYDYQKYREMDLNLLSKPIDPSELLNTTLEALNPSTAKSTSAIPSPCAPPAETICRVLVAEDNPFNQTLIIRILEKAGHYVTIANTGLETLEHFDRDHYDIILMDVQMPEMDGLEATARIREKEKRTGGRIPILAVTASAFKGDMEKCLASGMDDYISKPIKANIVLDKIQRFTRHESSGSEFAPSSNTPGELSSTRSINDPNAILEQVDGDLDEMKDLVNVFLSDTQHIRNKIRQAIDTQNFNDLKEAAHSLKGTVSFFTADKAREAALRLEMKGRNRDSEHLEDDWNSLEVEMAHLYADMQNLGWLSSTSSQSESE